MLARGKLGGLGRSKGRGCFSLIWGETLLSWALTQVLVHAIQNIIMNFIFLCCFCFFIFSVLETESCYEIPHWPSTPDPPTSVFWGLGSLARTCTSCNGSRLLNSVSVPVRCPRLSRRTHVFRQKASPLGVHTSRTCTAFTKSFLLFSKAERALSHKEKNLNI